MNDRPFAHVPEEELDAKSHRAIRELRRREKEAERDARLRRAESIIADLQTTAPAGQLKLARRVDRIARTGNVAAEIANAALRGRIRVGNELEAEIKERKGDRDRIERRVTGLELREIDRNPRQNHR